MAPSGRGKLGLLGAGLFAAALLFLPLVEARPNRVLSGQGLILSQFLPPWGMWVTAAACILALAYALWRSAPGAQAVAALLAAALLGVLYWLSSQPQYAQNGVRLSLGAGFWLALLGAVMMLHPARPTQARRARLLYLALLALLAVMLLGGWLDGLALVQEYITRRDTFWQQTGRHLLLAASATASAAALGIPLGVAMARRRLVQKPVMLLMNVAQTIPTLSLLGLLIVPLSYLGRTSPLLRAWGVSGVGFWPGWIALLLYALFPILHNTLAGLQLVDSAVLQAGAGMGMSRRQLFWRVQLPLAVPLILAGVRTAMTQSMGNATLAALIGAGGLGSLIFLGLAQSAPDLILLGAIPLVALTLALDALLRRAVILLSGRWGRDRNPAA